LALELEWRLGSNELGSNILELIVILGLELGLRSSWSWSWDGVGVGVGEAGVVNHTLLPAPSQI
jgi:hypothetical protein